MSLCHSKNHSRTIQFLAYETYVFSGVIAIIATLQTGCVIHMITDWWKLISGHLDMCHESHCLNGSGSWIIQHLLLWIDMIWYDPTWQKFPARFAYTWYDRYGHCLFRMRWAKSIKFGSWFQGSTFSTTSMKTSRGDFALCAENGTLCPSGSHQSNMQLASFFKWSCWLPVLETKSTLWKSPFQLSNLVRLDYDVSS